MFFIFYYAYSLTRRQSITLYYNWKGTVGNKIQQKVENGQFSQTDLMQDAQRMMSGLKNNNFGGASAPPSNPTRDRLRKKLEERKKKK